MTLASALLAPAEPQQLDWRCDCEPLSAFTIIVQRVLFGPSEGRTRLTQKINSSGQKRFVLNNCLYSRDDRCNEYFSVTEKGGLM